VESALGCPNDVTEARAAVTGHKVRYVLAFSLIGIIAAFIVIYFLFFG
jgi:acid phosphatase family membrane protein YuiD